MTNAESAAAVKRIRTLDLSPVEAWLAEAARAPEALAVRHGRMKAEAMHEQAWTCYDDLSDPTTPPRALVTAAQRLDSLLGLGWQQIVGWK